MKKKTLLNDIIVSLPYLLLTTDNSFSNIRVFQIGPMAVQCR